MVLCPPRPPPAGPSSRRSDASDQYRTWCAICCPASPIPSAAAGPLDGLRTALSSLGAAEGFRPLWDVGAEERRRNLIRLIAVTPSLIAAIHRLSHGLEPVEPDPELDHAANYLWMVSGSKPDPVAARAVEQYLILTVDHGFNSSTFTARVIASTGADAAAAAVGAIGALSGPLHGGAPSRALDTLDAIGRPTGPTPSSGTR